MLTSNFTLPCLRSSFSVICAVFLLFVWPSASRSDALTPHADAARQATEYLADAPKSIVELQQCRTTTRLAISGPGGSSGQATLVQLNPQINAWLLLMLDWGTRAGRLSYHLENPEPREQRISLSGARSVTISRGNVSTACELWSEGANSPIEQARRSGLPYAPLCGGRLYLRNPTRGSYTQLEKATGFLRQHVWGGEKIIGFVRKEFFRDKFMERGKVGSAAPAAASASPAAPVAAAVNPRHAERAITPEHLGIDLDIAVTSLAPGRWYPVDGVAGAYISLIQPQAIAAEVLNSYRTKLNPPDTVEDAALDYMIAFDLGQFDLGFSLGTEHPALGWSERVLETVRAPRLPGPDGTDSATPLVRTGMVSPALAPQTIATFTGGFKRTHGAFRYGPLANRNKGSHYGFMEQGLVFSKLQPGLATLYVLDDGSVDMKTWTTQDDALLARVQHARQNGVALLEYDPAAANAVPGALVTNWGAGNWSGSTSEQLRALRAGACVQQTPSRRFLIYGYFSSATPSAMARVFQAYGCRYAMLLDMNALEHTYLALYRRNGAEMEVQHLIEGMAQVDKKAGGKLLPRFIAYPDNRDFFYLVRRGERP